MVGSRWPIKDATAVRDCRVGMHNILLPGGATLPWARCMSVQFKQLARIGPSRMRRTAKRDYFVGHHDILLKGGASPCVRVTFEQVPRTGPSMTARAAVRDYRLSPLDVPLA